MSPKIKIFLRCLIITLVFLYSFLIPSFGNRHLYNYSIYLCAAALAVATFLYTFLYSNFKFNKITLFVPAFAIFSLLGTSIYSHNFRGVLTLVILAMSFYVLLFSFIAIGNRNIIFNALLCGLFLFSAYYIFHYRNEILHFSSYSSDEFRLGTFFDNQNDVASYATIGFFLSFYQLIFTKRWIKFLYIIPAFTLFIVGITTGSRTFILLVVFLIFILLFFKLIKHKIIYLAVLASLIVVFVVLINMPFLATIKLRLDKMLETLFLTPTSNSAGMYDTSTIQRVVLIDYGTYLGGRNAFIGYGYGGFNYVTEIGTFAHSNFAEVLCDFGIIGIILFYSPLLLLSFGVICKRNINIRFVLPIFIYYLLASTSTVFFYNKMYYLVLSLCFYLSYYDDTPLKNRERFKRILFVSDLDNYDKNISDSLKVFNSASSFKVILLANSNNKLSNFFRVMCTLFFKKNDTVVTLGKRSCVLIDYLKLDLDIVHIPLVLSADFNSYFVRRIVTKNQTIVVGKKSQDIKVNKFTYHTDLDFDSLLTSYNTFLAERNAYENTFNW